MDECCPHCGARLPLVRDAFCGECRADLSEPPASPGAAALIAIPPSAEEVASDQQKALRIAVATSIGFYAILIGLLFDAGVRAKLVEAFGREPLGMRAVVFAGLLQTLLYLPMPRAFYHLALIGEQARREGRLLLGLRALPYIAEVDRRHPHLARSRRICLWSLVYFVAVAGAWIVYAAALGI